MDDFPPHIDQRLWEAYLSTTYRILPAAIDLRIGQANHHLNEMLIDNNAFSWAFITACNPRSLRLSANENQKRHLQLQQQLDTLAFSYCEGLGIGNGSDWAPEISWFIMGIGRKRAIEIGKEWEQNAIVIGQLGGVPQLKLC